MSVRILITGSRLWTDRAAIRAAIVKAGREAGACPQKTVIVHGGARGADTIAGNVAREFGCQIERHPADWDRYGRSAGHRRNTEMVALGADVLLAFPLGRSPGTRNCMELARAAGIPVIDHDPAVTR